MAVKLVRENRLEWIDWMKALGIYLIVLGHFYSIGEKFIYVFHVPLFFVISGFLNKTEVDAQVFWKKLWYNLAVPMLLMATINFAYHSILQFFNGSFSPADVYWFVRNVLFGMVSGYDALWFVYTLIVCKIILQYLPSKMFSCSLLFLNLTFLILAYVLKQRGIFYYSSIVDVLLAMPFFSMGYILRSRKQILSEVSSSLIVCIILLGGVCVWLCGMYNEVVMLYRCDYGSNLLLCLIGGFMGSALIYGISYSLRLYLIDIAKVIGGGYADNTCSSSNSPSCL